MPVKYKIDPSINLLYYLGRGLCTGGELLQAENLAFNDPMRRHGMKILIDLRFSEMDIHLQDMRDLIKRNRELHREGHELEPTAFITRNTTLSMIGEAFLLMATGLPLQMNISHTIHDAIQWLGLLEAEETVLQIGELLAKG